MDLILYPVLLSICIYPLVSSQAGPEIQTRLRFGENPLNRDYISGRLEVSINGTVWGAVCDDFFNKNAARVVCKKFNYIDGEAVSKSFFNGTIPKSILLDNVECTGSEATLTSCSKGTWGEHDCEPTEHVGVFCFNDTSKVLKMNLVNGKDTGKTLSGRVEVALGSMPYGSVCDDLFTDKAATVTCQYFNYKYGQRFTDATFGQGTTTYLDEVLCNGTESNLLQCRHNSWREHDCGNEEDVGVVCFNSTSRIKTKTKDIDYAGTIQMWTTASGWVEICHDSWDDVDAKVACRDMGFVDGKALCCSALHESPWGSFIYNGAFTNVSCTGNEEHLADCKMVESGRSCGLAKSATAICYNTTVENVDNRFDVRLIGGADNWGKVEVRHLGIWLPVCPNDWSDQEASVVCKSKGFAAGKSFGEAGGADATAWLTKINCTGSEKLLTDCDIGEWGNVVSKCKPVSVLCYKTGVSLELSDPSNDFSGRVLINYDGVKGTICNTGSIGDSEARSICKDLGHKDGQIISTTDTVDETMPIYMTSLKCASYKSSMFECSNTGWNITDSKCTSHAQDVSVHCFADGRLYPGRNGVGAVQIYDRGWRSVCGTEGFDDMEALVFCKELGYKNGVALPPKVFGRVTGPHVRSGLSCNGTESSLLECGYNTTKGYCLPSGVSYASVSCYNTPIDASEPKFKLEGGSIDDGSERSYGRIRILGYNTYGYACDEYWTDKEADVMCKQLNFMGGKAYRYDGNYVGPFFINEIKCTGAETKIEDCSQGEELCHAKDTAGVLCYKTEAPKLTLVPAGSNTGRLQFMMDGEVGRICGDQWDKYDAAVACHQLGYTDGTPITFPPSNGAVFISQTKCIGSEESLFKCSNPGWKGYGDTECSSADSKDAGVFCFQNVRLIDGKVTSKYAEGKVSFYDKGTWRWVCDDGFGQVDAEVMCKEMGFTNAAILKSGTVAYQPKFVRNMNCVGNETDASKCEYDVGTCNYYKGISRIVCFTGDQTTAAKYYIEEGGYSGRIFVERHGINGTICEEGWDDTDASVLCKSMKYAGGVAFGTKASDDHDLVWFTGVDCFGNETNLDQCSRNYSVESTCRLSQNSAGVLCYNTGVDIRLANGGANYGRVEVSYDGVWGTICDYAWSRYDAKTLCKQLGYVEGIAYARSRYGDGTGPVYMDEMRCRVDDENLFACPNRGFNKSARYCQDHQNDVGVFCFSKVRLQPEAESPYGYINYWTGFSYSRVCGENFTAKNALVTCRELNFATGKALYGSPFGSKLGTNIGVTNVQCSGQETKLEDCDKKEETTGCDSAEYASVVCSNNTDSTAYTVRLSGTASGRVIVKHMDHDGYICGNDFSVKDANTVCKELNFYSGIPFKYISDRSTSRVTDLRWLNNLSCSGNELKIDECKGAKWGQLEGCSVQYDAGAYCFENEELSKIKFRQVGGDIDSEGRVEMKLNGTWGSICALGMSDASVNVLCKHLGYKSGVRLSTGSRWAGNGPIHITRLDCDDTAQEIYDCGLSGFGQSDSSCNTRFYDVALKCYTDAKIVGGKTASNNFGRVEIAENNTNTFVPVCDTTFDDTAAGVLCRQLGFKDGSSQCCNALGYIYTRSDRYVTKLECTGTEKSVSDCTTEFGECSERRYATAFCRDTVEVPKQFDIKLSGKMLNMGTVNISRNGIWGGVCSRGFGDLEAKTACIQNGFVNGFASKPFRLSSGLPIVMGNVSCTENTTRLDQCQYEKFGDDQGCRIYRTAATVLCSETEAPIQYRIAGGGHEGRAEVFYEGSWGTISKSSFGATEATAFCKGAGFVGGEVYFPASPDYGLLNIRVSSVDCTSTAKTLVECGGYWGNGVNQRVSPTNAVFVNCFKHLRIDRGDQSTNGIIKIHNGDEWGTFCAKDFDDVDAGVACREMGYQSGKALCCAPYGFNFDDALISEIECNGTEKSILDCKHKTVDSYTSSSSLCYRQEYASIACFNSTSSSYKVGLAGGSNYTGAVTLEYLGIDGRICNDGWDDNDALVICKELGYTKGESYQHYKSSFEFFAYSGPYWTSNVTCTGSETSLGECRHAGFGNVKSCESRHHAGVICYDNSEIFYRLSEGGDNNGLVEVSVNGQWGTICDRFWDKRDASVFCKNLGYVDGEADYKSTFDKPSSGTLVWESNLRCNGDETNINDCPHEGWQHGVSATCSGHSRDAAAYCYTGVKLSTGVGKSEKHGAVMIYDYGQWWRVCDKGFTDTTAATICRELGFVDGKAICCSAYGDSIYTDILTNKTVQCNGDEKFVHDCLRTAECDSGYYASVACISADSVNQTATKIAIDSQKEGNGKVSVTKYGVKGRICYQNWTDEDATVLCRMKNFKNGIAYKHSDLGTFVSDSESGPYWFSNFSCVGNETDILDCPYNDRFHLGNCSDDYTASVLCYNTTGIEYRIAGGGDFHGRVEVSIGGKWGTVCDSYWDDRDARVFCRQQKFNGGTSLATNTYGPGTGPIWLSHLQCKGSESNIHQCAHRGFDADFSTVGWPFTTPCSSHDDDAAVFCYRNTRLNKGFSSEMGGLEIFRDEKWTGVCDTGLDNKAAKVACKSLGKNFTDGRVVKGSSFGDLNADDVTIKQITCTGTEDDISDCTIISGSCDGGKDYYAGVVCSESKFNTTGFEVRLASDGLSQEYHGIIEVSKNDIWGRICMQGWGDTDANTACKSLGFAGGVSYLHIVKNTKPMLIRNVTCTGRESSFENCYYDESPDLENCGFDSNDGGAICYNNSGISYRLNGGKDLYSGRVEIQYEGSWGSVCSWAWNSKNAKVFCKSIGYKDGIPRYDTIPSLPTLDTYLNGVFCNGEESTLLRCLNSGFKSTLLGYLCNGNAYASCYNDEVAVSKVRLYGSNSASTGLVQVYVDGPNQWGTVCDDYWDDIDANVVCKELGFDEGKVVKGNQFQKATGPIWLDNVECVGNETSLADCANRGFGTHNCNHTEDAAVECFRRGSTPIVVPITTSPAVKTTVPPVQTTQPPVKTTKLPVKTTQLPVKTTHLPVKTTQLPVKTTQAPVKTTQVPVKTTQVPVKTTQSPDKTSDGTTTEGSTTLATVGGPKAATQANSQTLALAIVIPIIVLILIAVAIIAFILYRKRRHTKGPISHERFHDDIIEQTRDGSLAMRNQMFDMNAENNPTDPFDTEFMPGDSEITIGENGYAHFAKTPAPEANGDTGFSNPLYNMTPAETISSEPAKLTIDVHDQDNGHSTT